MDLILLCQQCKESRRYVGKYKILFGILEVFRLKKYKYQIQVTSLFYNSYRTKLEYAERTVTVCINVCLCTIIYFQNS